MLILDVVQLTSYVNQRFSCFVAVDSLMKQGDCKDAQRHKSSIESLDAFLLVDTGSGFPNVLMRFGGDFSALLMLDYRGLFES